MKNQVRLNFPRISILSSAGSQWVRIFKLVRKRTVLPFFLFFKKLFTKFQLVKIPCNTVLPTHTHTQHTPYISTRPYQKTSSMLGRTMALWPENFTSSIISSGRTNTDKNIWQALHHWLEWTMHCWYDVVILSQQFFLLREALQKCLL